MSQSDPVAFQDQVEAFRADVAAKVAALEELKALIETDEFADGPNGKLVPVTERAKHALARAVSEFGVEW